MFTSLADTDLSVLAKDRASGNQVNNHVVEQVKAPKPDYEEMRRLIQGESQKSESGHQPRK